MFIASLNNLVHTCTSKFTNAMIVTHRTNIGPISPSSHQTVCGGQSIHG